MMFLRKNWLHEHITGGSVLAVKKGKLALAIHAVI